MKEKLLRATVGLLLALALSGCNKAEDKKVAEVSTAKPAQKLTGEAIFVERCRDCHKVRKIGGTVGPDLSGVGAKRSAEFLEQVIRNPSQQYPGTVMPSFDRLPTDQINLLVDYLSWL